MAKLRHMVLTVSDPLALAETFVRLFDFTLMRYEEEYGAFLTDGYFHLVVCRAQKAGPQDVGTVHHLGFYADDVDAIAQLAQADGLPEGTRSVPFSRYFTTPDGWAMEIRERGWDEPIQIHTPLLELTDAAEPKIRTVTRRPDGAESDRPGFVRVCATADLPPGGASRIEVGDHQILLANVDGTYCAVSDQCPHLPRLGRLSEGVLTGNLVECPAHGSQFEVTTGDVLTFPAARGLPTYDVTVEDGDVWVGLEVRSTGSRAKLAPQPA